MKNFKRGINFNIAKEGKKLGLQMLMLTLALIILCGLIYGYGMQLKDRECEEAIKSDLDENLKQVNEIFVTYKVMVEQAQYNLFLKNFLIDVKSRDDLKQNTDYESLLKEFKEISQEHDSIKIAWAADYDGNFFIEDNGYISDDKWNFIDRPWYKLARESKGGFVSEPFVAASNGAPTVSVFSSLYDDSNNFLGVFAVDVSFSYMLKIMKSIEIDKDEGLMLLTGENQVVYDSSGRYNFQSFDNTFYNKKAIKSVKTGETKTFYTDTAKPYYTAMTGIDVPGWKLILSGSKDALERRSEGYGNRYYALSVGTLLILYLLFAIIFFTRYRGAAKAKKITDYDELTGVFSGKGLSKEVERILAHKDDSNYYYAAFRVRKINMLNEMLGFEKVDLLFLHIVSTLKNEIKSGECYGRIFGNLFAVLIQAENKEAAEERLKELDRKITDYNLVVRGSHVIQLEFGVYEIEGPVKFDKIQSYTDFTLEMVQNISSYESIICFYDDELKNRQAYENQLETDMEDAVKNDEFDIHIQGKYDINTSKIKSAEVLVRWNHPKRGLISPLEFIPLFEKNGFIIKLDFIVFEKACILLRSWIDRGITPVPLAINMSRLHLNDVRTADIFDSILQKHRVPPQLLQLELTESALSGNVENLSKILNDFKEKQLSVAIDDFGTGYSTLSVLKELTFDTLKIDREFFVDMQDNDRGRAIVRSVISMAKELKLETVSEGIETKEQVAFLKEVDCDLVQGFYFSRPLVIEEFEKILKG